MYYAVRSGNLFRCVQADDAFEACRSAVRRHLIDPIGLDFKPGKVFEVIGEGQTTLEMTVVATKNVLEALEYAATKPV